MDEAWRLPETLLPDGDRRDLWVSGGRLTTEPVAHAEPLPGTSALPGLVDAHCHLALDPDARGRGVDGVRTALRRVRDRGVLLVRDVGAPKSVTLDLSPNLDLPDLLAAGRWLAPEGSFFPDLHDPVPGEDLAAAARAEIDHGARWVKIIADWAHGEGADRMVLPSYDLATLRSLVDAVHSAGARVAAHANSEFAADLVGIGVDSIEHGTSLDQTTLRVMADRGIAWTPTLCAITSPLPDDASEERRTYWKARREHVAQMVPMASALGVTIMTGTDTAGTIAQEVALLRRFGLEPLAALEAATTSARRFLGAEVLAAGAPADVVTYESDPREHPEVLDRPAAIVLRGRRVH